MAERLAEKMFSPLWRFLVRQMNVPEPDGEELVQDTLIKVHASVKKFHRERGAKFTTWIFQIAYNKAIDFFRASRMNLEELTEADLPVPERGEFAGRNAELLARLRDALEKLSGADQCVLIWGAQGFSFAQIGEWLGIKKGTARVRYCRAKKKLGLTSDHSEVDESSVEQNALEVGGAHE